jgi:DNA-binding transcriptional LysR family regulator
MALDLRSVDVFRAVATTGSATHAAAQLGTTQPTVTRAIADRGRFGMRLTTEGQLLLDAVQRSFAGLEFIAQTAGSIRAGAYGTLRLSTMPVLGEGMFADLFGEFLGAQPNVQLSIDLMSPVATMQALAGDRVDLAAFAGPVPDDLACETMVVGSATLELVVGIADPLAEHGPVELAQLSGRDMALVRAPHIVRALVENALFNAGVRPRLCHEVTTQRAAASLAASGRCIAFVDSHIAATLDTRKIAVVPLKQRLSWPISLVWRRGGITSPVLAVFLDWLRARDIDRGRPRAVS